MFDNLKLNNTGTQNKPKETDSNPIGTILTVPLKTNLTGYINYVEGSTFDSSLYPELFQILGTNEFSGLSNGSNFNLPIGSIIYWLSTELTIPDGFVEWNTFPQSLIRFPELVRSLTIMANQLPEGKSKEAWLSALAQNTFPVFEHTGFYLHGSLNQIGLYETDTNKQSTLQVFPAVVDFSNTLNPLGFTRPLASKESLSVLNTDDVNQTNVKANYVIPVQTSDIYPETVEKNLYQINFGSGQETKPRSLNVRILVKAKMEESSQVSQTHKRIIKAF